MVYPGSVTLLRVAFKIVFRMLFKKSQNGRKQAE